MYNIISKFLTNQHRRSVEKFTKIIRSEETEIIVNNKDDIFLNIIIPVFNRTNYLINNVKCLLKQKYNNKINVAITVCEMDEEKKCKSFCIKNKINYIFLKSNVFNKSFAMNYASYNFQSRFYLFHDVDLLVEKGWIQKCIETIENNIKKNNYSFICQPIPQRKIFYVNKFNTNMLFENNLKIDDLFNLKDHLIQPEWFKKNYPPGGSILISEDLLYSIQGFDEILFWNYSPEDLVFLKRAVSLSQENKLETWDFGPNVLHMFHESTENNNDSYEYMIFIADLIVNSDYLMKQYNIFKLKNSKFNIKNSMENNFSLKRAIE